MSKNSTNEDVFAAKAAVETLDDGFHVEAASGNELHVMSTTWGSGRGEGPDEPSVKALVAASYELGLACGTNHKGRDELLVSVPIEKVGAFVAFVKEFDPDESD